MNDRAGKGGERSAPPRSFVWAALVLCGVAFAINRIVAGAQLPLQARDFTNLWVAGHLALRGDIHRIFDQPAFFAATEQLFGAVLRSNYSYPPHALFLAVPFGGLPYLPSLILWDVLSLAIFFLAARPWLGQGVRWWFAVLSPATLQCLVYGHYGLIFGALWLWSFRGSGLSAAILTFKPHMGLLIAVQMLRDRKALPVALACTFLLVGLSMLCFGLWPWQQFFTANMNYLTGQVAGGRPGLMTAMVTPFLTYGIAGQVLFALAAIALLIVRFDVFTAATASFLILPYGFHYDMTAASLGFALCLAGQWERLQNWQRATLMLAYLIPGLITVARWAAPPLLLLALAAQVLARPVPAPPRVRV